MEHRSKEAIRPIGPSIAYIPLSRGLFSLVDADDADLLSQWHWNVSAAGYGVRLMKDGGLRKHTSVHRIVMGLPNGDPRQVDHKNMDTLDNRKANLRICTHQQNMANRIISNTKSGLKGAYFRYGGWDSKITFNNKRIFLGRFRTAEEAHKAFCDASVARMGEFSRGSL